MHSQRAAIAAGGQRGSPREPALVARDADRDVAGSQRTQMDQMVGKADTQVIRQVGISVHYHVLGEREREKWTCVRRERL